jgi:LysM repeat protein
MAIQQVGGQGVYVITGSGRDPRRTSNGQSWADLVTKQKYMLYKSAHDQAVREYEAGRITDKERQKRIDQLRKDIRQERTDIARLERQQLSKNELRERMRKREELKLGTETIRSPIGADGSTEGTFDSGIPLVSEYQQTLEKRISNQSSLKSRALGDKNKFLKIEDFERALKKKAKNQQLNPKQQKAYDENIKAYNSSLKAIANADTKIEDMSGTIEELAGYDQAQFEVFYNNQVLKGGDPSTTKGGRGPSRSRGSITTKKVDKGVDVALPDVDYSAEIGEREDRIAALNRQILEAASEPRDDLVNVIKREQEIARNEYGLGRPMDRRRLFGRRAEMEALGMEEEEPQVEEVEPDRVSEMMTEGQAVDRAITSPTEQRYIVQEGDTLGSVAQQYYGDPSRFADIAQASGIQDPNRIEVGQKLIIPQDQPQMQTAPVAEPMVEELVEEQAIAPIQPKPAQTQIGDALRQDVIDRQAREEEMRRNQQLPEATPDALNPLKPATSNSPTPTPTGQPRVRQLGRIRRFSEAMAEEPRRNQRPPTPPLQLIRQAFDPVRNLDRREKQQVGLQLLQQAKQAYGVSSKEYQKVKDQILSELGRAIDPKKAKQMKVVKDLQETSPSQYYRLGDDIRGLSEESKRMVVQLFPVNDETKLDEIESLYKNAQQQLKLSVVDKSQKKKALDMLDLMYMAVISDKR